MSLIIVAMALTTSFVVLVPLVMVALLVTGAAPVRRVLATEAQPRIRPRT